MLNSGNLKGVEGFSWRKWYPENRQRVLFMNSRHLNIVDNPGKFLLREIVTLSIKLAGGIDRRCHPGLSLFMPGEPCFLRNVAVFIPTGPDKKVMFLVEGDQKFLFKLKVFLLVRCIL
jgi:hypothetical protein